MAKECAENPCTHVCGMCCTAHRKNMVTDMYVCLSRCSSRCVCICVLCGKSLARCLTICSIYSYIYNTDKSDTKIFTYFSFYYTDRSVLYTQTFIYKEKQHLNQYHNTQWLAPRLVPCASPYIRIRWWCVPLCVLFILFII